MSQPILMKSKNTNAIHTWLFQDTVNLECEKDALHEAQKKLREEQIQLECAIKGFLFEKKMKEDWLKKQQTIFDEKWRILEVEMKTVANEKLRLQNKQQNKTTKNISTITPKASYFFRGITNILTLKKRYKDLIKIYHPDNLAGDTMTVQEINRQYEELQQEW